MHLAYTLAFLCLLRFNEVLKIKAHYIKVVGLFNLRGEEIGEIKLTLPFYKTKQLGGKFLLIFSKLALFTYLLTYRG
jgi:hypothetical protein